MPFGAVNLTSRLPAAAAGRQSEVSAADWDTGVNPGGDNAPGIGISTGGYSLKTIDWAEIVINPQTSQRLGTAAENLVEPVDGNDQFAFVQTAGIIAPGGALITGVVNRTGLTVPSGAWAWGTKTIA